MRAFPLLASKQQVKDYLRERISSREWWLLLPAPEFSAYVIAIEEQYYSGEANKDFAAILSPTSAGPLSIYVAHKRRMSAQQLVNMLKDGAALPITVGQLKKHDIVFLSAWNQSQTMLHQLAEVLES